VCGYGAERPPVSPRNSRLTQDKGQGVNPGLFHSNAAAPGSAWRTATALLLALALRMRVRGVLVRRLGMLMGGRAMLAGLGVITLAVMLGGGAVRLGRMVVGFGRFVVMFERHSDIL